MFRKYKFKDHNFYGTQKYSSSEVLEHIVYDLKSKENKKGNVRIIAGDAPHKFWKELSPYIKKSAKKGVHFTVIAGPLISIDDFGRNSLLELTRENFVTFQKSKFSELDYQFIFDFSYYHISNYNNGEFSFNDHWDNTRSLLVVSINKSNFNNKLEICNNPNYDNMPQFKGGFNPNEFLYSSDEQIKYLDEKFPRKWWRSFDENELRIFLKGGNESKEFYDNWKLSNLSIHMHY